MEISLFLIIGIGSVKKPFLPVAHSLIVLEIYQIEVHLIDEHIMGEEEFYQSHFSVKSVGLLPGGRQ
jgi:hypothetical protein